MFDEKTPQNPDEPEDIFYPVDGKIEPGEIKSALAHQKLKPVSGGGPLPEPPSLPAEQSEISPPLLSKKGLFLGVGVVVVVIVLVVGGVWYWQSAKTKKTVNAPLAAPALPVPQPELAPVAPTAPTAPTEPIVIPEPIPPPAPPAPVDTDNDGLTDEEELNYSTNASQADTDQDDLSDYEEIMIWKTNPLNPDTDGDTFPDGIEVRNNYNPNGPGKLLEIPK